MWYAITCAVVSAYASHEASRGYALCRTPKKQQLDWERDQIRRKHERDAEDRKVRRQGMYGTMLLIAFALSVGYLVSGLFA